MSTMSMPLLCHRHHPRTRTRRRRSLLLLASLARSASAIHFHPLHFDDGMVLQRGPSRARIYGSLEYFRRFAVIEVTVTPASDPSNSYSVTLKVHDGIDRQTGEFSALLRPHGPEEGEFSISVSCVKKCEADIDGHPKESPSTAAISGVVFGDVWFCAGQNNMALPILYTLTREKSVEAIKGGKYSKVRLFSIEGNMSWEQPWAKAIDMIDSGDFDKYSSTCWYFAEALTDRLGGDEEAPPIGLVHVSYASSKVEDWLDDATLATCTDVLPRYSKNPDGWDATRVEPFTQMTIKGWLWYQGELNMQGRFGNYERKSGYACLLPALVSSWRKKWSETPETTPPDAPFGFVTLPPSGGQNFPDVGAFRLAQTAGYGWVPNPALPNTFAAQAYDLDDPYPDPACYNAGCCDPTVYAYQKDTPSPCSGDGCSELCGPCGAYCDSLRDTTFFMSSLHPRSKRELGQRLAQAAAVEVYGESGPSTGPTLAGCMVRDDGVLTIQFDRANLKEDTIEVRDYRQTTGLSKMEVLVDPDGFCLQRQKPRNGGDAVCVDKGNGRTLDTTIAGGDDTNWVEVDFAARSDFEVDVNLAARGIILPFAIRYAWQGLCCDMKDRGDDCPVASCPIVGSNSSLPANPFLAIVTQAGCNCIPPAKCSSFDEEASGPASASFPEGKGQEHAEAVAEAEAAKGVAVQVIPIPPAKSAEPAALPTAAPVGKFTVAPVAPPTAAPVGKSTVAPVAPPTAAPVGKSMAAPVAPPTAAPVGEPMAAPEIPTPPPTSAVIQPVLAPTEHPSLVPIPAPGQLSSQVEPKVPLSPSGDFLSDIEQEPTGYPGAIDIGPTPSLAAAVMASGKGNAQSAVHFSTFLGDGMVLQREPAAAAVFGTVDHKKAKKGGDTASGASESQPVVKIYVVSSGAEMYSVMATVTGSDFKAILRPEKAGTVVSIKAECTSGCPLGKDSAATLHDVIFGDVWFCAGSNNMATHLQYTMSRNVSVDAVRDGLYDNIRLLGLESNANFPQPWAKPSDALKEGTFLKYSAACWYFAESLTDRLNGQAPVLLGVGRAPPLGLIHVSVAHSKIEDWVDDDVLSQCADISTRNGQNPHGWFPTRVAPFADNMTLKGFLWYAGEVDVLSARFGSYGHRSGFACLQVEMVRSWRNHWSKTPGTTDPQAPFGIVILHPTGSHEPNDIGALRWAQTGGYGVLPNSAMRNTFQAQAYDLGDPYPDRSCYDAGCCGPGVLWAYSQEKPGKCSGYECEICKMDGIQPAKCDGYCTSLASTDFFAGPEQPRSKRAVGDRLASAAAASVYNVGAGIVGGAVSAVTGPTLAGCKRDGESLIIRFHKGLLAGDIVEVRDYDQINQMSKMEVLVDSKHFCMQRSFTDPGKCIDDGFGHEISGKVVDASKWVPVDISSSAGRNEIIADLSSTGGIAHAVRYAWEGTCCPEGPEHIGEECPLASCPVMSKKSGLPANPFIAKITWFGQCECIHPQTCDMFDQQAPRWHDPITSMGRKFLAIISGSILIVVIGLWKLRSQAILDEAAEHELEKLTDEHVRSLTEGFVEVEQEDREYKDRIPLSNGAHDDFQAEDVDEEIRVR